MRQHAHNPVDWYPWGTEALDRARSENKPILLSIGYAACHWCHVMERESFEDRDTAALMNENFVCIKVDREERPDVDSVYMDAVQAMTGHGGWPMTIFLTPDQVPFFGGTYFPPEDTHGMPAFRKVLHAVAEAWRDRRSEAVEQGERILQHLRMMAAPKPSRDPLADSLIGLGAHQILDDFDERHGGFGNAPKFPQPQVLEFLMRAARRGNPDVRGPLEMTLRKMALGGIYDQLGGGFHRYTVDAAWLVPHFEKMLYDNAQLVRVYTHAWQLWRNPLFRRIAVETIEYLLRDMRDPGGAFYSSEDADSEGEEGRFYVWDYSTFVQVAPEAATYYGATPEGNFEGRNILTASDEEPETEPRRKLLEVRATRERPPRDDKVLTSWNGLAIAALAEAGSAFARTDFIQAAREAAAFLVASTPENLMHSYKDGHHKINGLLEDYAFLADGLICLYEATFEVRWLEGATHLARSMLERFWDDAEGGFFTTASDHESLIVRQKEVAESATPSANAIASLVIQRLGVLYADSELSRKGAEALRVAHEYMEKAPRAASSALSALDFYLATPKEIAIVGDLVGGEDLLSQIWHRFLPNRVIAASVSGIESPLLEGKTPLDNKLTAYVCENYTCKAPTADPNELARQLDEAAI